MLRLLRFSARYIGPMPLLRLGPMLRTVSPSGDSTLMTSAPRSARICEANGPITTVVRSMILTPASGPAPLTVLSLVELMCWLRVL